LSTSLTEFIVMPTFERLLFKLVGLIRHLARGSGRRPIMVLHPPEMQSSHSRFYCAARLELSRFARLI
jgi:hypothetical protein